MEAMRSRREAATPKTEYERELRAAEEEARRRYAPRPQPAPGSRATGCLLWGVGGVALSLIVLFALAALGRNQQSPASTYPYAAAVAGSSFIACPSPGKYQELERLVRTQDRAAFTSTLLSSSCVALQAGEPVSVRGLYQGQLVTLYRGNQTTLLFTSDQAVSP